MLGPHEEPAGAGLGLGERAGHVVHRAAGDAPLGQARLPLAARGTEQDLLHTAEDLVAVLPTTFAAREPVVGQERIGERLHEPTPHAVVADEEREVTVGGPEVLRGHERRVRGVLGAR